MLLTERKMEVLRRLEGAEKSPSELAEEMDLTISSVSKHLNSLEDLGLVLKSGKKKGKTRSYWKYKLEDFVYFVFSLDGRVGKRRLSLNENHKVHFRIWSVPQPEFHSDLDRFWCGIQEDLEEVEGVMVHGSVARGDAREDSDIDLLIISDNESLEEKFGAKVIGEKMFMTTVFSEEDFEESFRKESSFARNVMEEGIIIYDQTGFLERMKNEYKERAS